MAVHEQNTWKPRAWLKQWVRVFKIHAYNSLHTTPTLFYLKALALFPTDHLLKPLLSHKPPLPTSTQKISKHYSGAQRPVWLDQKSNEGLMEPDVKGKT